MSQKKLPDKSGKVKIKNFTKETKETKEFDEVENLKFMKKNSQAFFEATIKFLDDLDFP